MSNDPQFDVKASVPLGPAVLQARGEIDVASAPEFHDALSGLIDQGPAILVVDLSEVSFIDSTGLGVLVSAEKQTRADGHELRLVVTHPQITRLLELTGLNEVFTVVSSAAEAARV